ncbi:MAG: Lrp/AsnC family transcriptional regulator [Thermoplasmata archaeon]
MKQKIDKIDDNILYILEEDSRLSATRLADRLGIPRTTVVHRLKKLVDNKIIKKFTIVRNHEILGDDIVAFVLVSFDNSKKLTQKKVANAISFVEGVEAVYIISGEYDILVKVRASSDKGIGEIVVDKIHSIEGVSKTLTLSCFFTIKE